MWERTREIPGQGIEPMALTALKVKNAKPGRHVDGRGLCLVVKPSGARTWVLRMQKDGWRRDYGLGSALDVSLAEAREAATALRRKVREGVDPIAERRKVRKGGSQLRDGSTRVLRGVEGGMEEPATCQLDFQP
jgi:hypothetical protein